MVQGASETTPALQAPSASASPAGGLLASAAGFLRGLDVPALRRLVAFGFGLRLLLWAISSGSGDIRGWARVAAEVGKRGIRGAFANGPAIRHSPVTLWWADTASTIATALEAPFEMVFKVAPLVADALLVALVMATIRRRGGTVLDAWRGAAIVATSLAGVWVTSHHGGLETVLILWALAAVVLVDEGDRPVLAGLALAGAIHMHLVAVVLVPALWLAQASSARRAGLFSAALALGLSPLALPLSLKGFAFISRAVHLTTPSNRWGLQFLLSEGGELPILGHFVDLIGARLQAESFTLAILASVALGVRARLLGRGGLETGALAIAAFLVVTPSIGLQYAAVPIAFLVVVDLRRALVYSATSGVYLTGAYLGFAKAEMPLVSVHGAPIGFTASLFAFASWLVLADLLLRRLWPRDLWPSTTSTTATDESVAEQALLPGLFVAIAAPMGVALALATPPFQVADEPLHAFTACAAAHGQLTPGHDAPAPWTTTLDVPNDLVAFNRAIARLKLPHKPATKASVPALNDAAVLPHDGTLQRISTRTETREMGVYPPVMYGPQVVVCAVDRAVGLRPWAHLSAMRLATLAAYILLGALALWWLPVGREVAALVLLSPMALSSGASASADGQLIPLVVVWLAFVLRLATRPTDRPLRAGVVVTATVIAGALSLAKSVYLPLAFAFLLLPRRLFSSGAHRLGTSALVVGVALVGAVIWIPQTDGGLDAWAATQKLDPAATFDARLEAPFSFILAALRTAFRERILTGVVGTLGWRDTVLPFSAVATFWAALVPLTILGGTPRASWRRGVGLMVLGLGAAAGLLLFYALYFTKPDARWISNVQGRHFLPSLFFIGVGLADFLGLDVGRRGRRRLLVVVGLASTFILVKALGAVEARYYRNPDDVPAVMRAAFSPPKVAPVLPEAEAVEAVEPVEAAAPTASDDHGGDDDDATEP